jgi:AbrB family looped-hinge helix DNA binding protein
METVIESGPQARARLNENGRVVIPATIRQKLGLSAGDTLLFSIDGDALRVESHRARIRRVQESLRRFIPSERCLTDELIADRREEARREMEEGIG